MTLCAQIVLLLGVLLAVGAAVAAKQGCFRRLEKKGGGAKGDSLYAETETTEVQML
jgi:hypothetical protein